MTREEFDNWTKITESSKRNWHLDEVTLHNRGVYLFYTGGENGIYINVDLDGLTTFGKYECAIPHIGDALFTIEHNAQFADQNTAITKLIEQGGLKFLLNLIGVRL